jgi:nuclease HARBI1
MVDALEIPYEIIAPTGSCFTGLEALALTFARFRTAGDLHELSTKYSRAQSSISEIVNLVATYIDTTWSHLLEFDHQHLLSPPNLQRYANAIHHSGAPLSGVWGFIDCTIRRICRPSMYQRQAYNGHKKFHALKFQAVMLPNGMFGHLFGAQEGRRNDSFLLNESRILESCAQHAIRDGSNENTPVDQRYFQLFGDPAYGVTPQIQSPFSGPGERTLEEREWNYQMSRARMAVEHGFGIVSTTWPFLNAGWKMHLGSSPVGRYYRTGVILTNALNCLHPNQVSKRFHCEPPSLEAYFHH